MSYTSFFGLRRHLKGAGNLCTGSLKKLQDLFAVLGDAFSRTQDLFAVLGDAFSRTQDLFADLASHNTYLGFWEMPSPAVRYPY